MFSNQPADLLLPTPLRTCCPVPSSRHSSRYLVGSSGSSSDNHVVHVLRYHEESNELGCDATLDHPTGEIWCLSSCPADATLMVTCGGGGGGESATTKVWRVEREWMEKEDELSAYDEDGANGTGGALSPSPEDAAVEMTGEATLFVDSDDVLGGRISCALFRPQPDDEFGGSGGGGGGGGGGLSAASFEGTGTDAAKDLITVSACRGTVTRWDLEAGGAEVAAIEGESSATAAAASAVSEHRAAWDPHNASLIAVATRTGLTVHDLRTASGGGGGNMGGAMHIGTDHFDPSLCKGLGDHRYGTTDVSYNPNLPNVLVSTGKDGLVKFWDLRTSTSSNSGNDSVASSSAMSATHNASTTNKTSRRRAVRPIKVLRGGHSHWSTRIAYNPHHDQLLLSSGTDGVVNLWRAGSVSSAPLLDLDVDGGGGEAEMIGEDRQDDAVHDKDGDNGDGSDSAAAAAGGADARVSTLDFPDSVYDITWSASDAWTFLAVGYDGTVSLNHVPSREKYKILL